ncbi:YihY/virulence factor BrkB family protein [Actinopolymorpha sp. B9G3]|uniref:YihY/virulence factor BrkB family protein n=1 Tax=Actinopolymorpha sp. B9G3 TaxID=3158970 RepID=UPI0032D90E13
MSGRAPVAGAQGERTRRGFRGSLAWRLLRGTVGACVRYRVTGLAAEGAFFAILSLPPLVFGLAGSIGYVVGGFGPDTVELVKAELVEVARGALTEQSVQSVIVPTLDAVLDEGRADVISVGFVLALWSGSRALNVFIDTIAIMHGLGGRRGIVKTRVLSFSLYVVALGMAIVVLPLVLAGPSLVDALLPARLDFLTTAYWPAVLVSSSVFLTTLYHLAVPKRTPWLQDFGGAVVAMVLWIAGSFALRWTLSHAIGSTSIYGPLAAPIAVLLWLYLIVISLLIGAAFSATFHRLLNDRMHPVLRQPVGNRQVGNRQVGNRRVGKRREQPRSRSGLTRENEAARRTAAEAHGAQPESPAPALAPESSGDA